MLSNSSTSLHGAGQRERSVSLFLQAPGHQDFNPLPAHVCKGQPCTEQEKQGDCPAQRGWLQPGESSDGSYLFD